MWKPRLCDIWYCTLTPVHRVQCVWLICVVLSSDAPFQVHKPAVRSCSPIQHAARPRVFCIQFPFGSLPLGSRAHHHGKPAHPFGLTILSPLPSPTPPITPLSFRTLTNGRARGLYPDPISLDWAKGVNSVLPHSASRNRAVCAERRLGRIRHSVGGFEDYRSSAFCDVQTWSAQRAARAEQAFRTQAQADEIEGRSGEPQRERQHEEGHPCGVIRFMRKT